MNITKRLFTIGCMAVSTMLAVADTLTIRSLFTEMPDAIIPYLTKTNRLDFIDFMDSNMKAEVNNELEGKSLMTALGDDSLTIRLNDACTVKMLLLPTLEPVDSSRHVIVLVRSLSLEDRVVENDVAYYTVRWRQLKTLPAMSADDKKRVTEIVEPSNILNFFKGKLNKE